MPTSIGAGLTSSRPEPWPSWKIQTSRPKVALRLSALIRTALIGSRIEPNARNIRIRVAPTNSPTIQGRRSAVASRLSMLRAVVPPTSSCEPAGTGMARIASTASRASSLKASFVFRVAVKSVTPLSLRAALIWEMPGTCRSCTAKSAGDAAPRTTICTLSPVNWG
jgi:hypothetical protein